LIIRTNEDGTIDFHDEIDMVEWQDFKRAV
jgi:hypothetical protein